MGSCLVKLENVLGQKRNERREGEPDQKDDPNLGLDGRKANEKTAKEVELLAKLNPEEVEFETYDFRKARVIDVYDGDTCTVIALHHGVPTKFRLRLMEINAPEVRGGTAESKEAGRLAKEFLANLILGKIVDVIVVENRKFLKKGDRIEFISEGKRTHESFGRLLSYIYVGGKSVSEMMLDAGHAVLF